jgi:chromate reductase
LVATPGLELSGFPYYDEDLDAVGGTPATRVARDLVASAAAMVISTPSYNGAAPGVLKNALDWLSRPWGDSALSGTPVAILSAAPGPRGAASAQAGLRTVLERSGAVLIEHPPVAIAHADLLARDAGGFTAQSAIAALDGLVDATLAQLRPGWQRPVPAAV